MRHLLTLSLAVLLAVSISNIGSAQTVADLSQDNGFGVGLELTAPFAAPDTFPASGFTTRLWIANLFGFEAAIFVVDGSPSLATRTFIKFVNTSLVDLYIGTGAAFFGTEGEFVVPLQALSGIEIRFNEHIALNAEVGLLFRGVSTVTAGFGFHFYL
jgi:hypothetical protein